MSWRQVDCKLLQWPQWKDTTYFHYTGHINNLYNTTFWALIQSGGMDAKEAEKALAVRFLMGSKMLISDGIGLLGGR